MSSGCGYSCVGALESLVPCPAFHPHRLKTTLGLQSIRGQVTSIGRHDEVNMSSCAILQTTYAVCVMGTGLGEYYCFYCIQYNSLFEGTITFGGYFGEHVALLMLRVLWGTSALAQLFWGTLLALLLLGALWLAK